MEIFQQELAIYDSRRGYVTAKLIVCCGNCYFFFKGDPALADEVQRLAIEKRKAFEQKRA